MQLIKITYLNLNVNIKKASLEPQIYDKENST